MPVFIAPAQEPKQPKKRVVKGRPVKPPLAPEVAYKRILGKQIKEMTAAAQVIINDLKVGILTESEALTLLAIAENNAQREFMGRAVAQATVFVNRVSEIQKQRMEGSLANSLGVDVLKVFSSEGVDVVFTQAVADNVKLIESISPEYHDKIRETITATFAGKPLPENRTLTQEIRAISKDTTSRPALIARDQVSKLNAKFNEARQESAGIEKYIWRTAEDTRVVGTPGGKYPEGNPNHMNHFARNGKTFEWANPPPDGHPGEPILCRCVAVPLVDRQALDIVQ